jgi:hypothetical protein
MLAVSNQVIGELLKYLADKPRTPELMALVRCLIRINPAFDKLLDIFVNST